MAVHWQALLRDGASARDKSDLAAALGPRLASMWFSPDALSTAVPTLEPGGRIAQGEFGVLLHLPDAGSHLHKGVVLPCRWAASVEALAWHVPRGLQELSERARTSVALNYFRGGASPEQRKRLQSLRLCLGRGCGDLSDLPVSPESAGALLVATLAVAFDDLVVRPHISASATFSDTDGVGSVEHMVWKRAAACRAGINTVLTAPGQIDAEPAEGAAPAAAIRIGDPREQLAFMLLQMNLPPAGGTLEDRRNWYRSASEWIGQEARTRAEDFYAEHLARDVVRHNRLDSSESGGTLILSATGSAEVSLLAIASHRPSQLIIVMLNDESRKYATRLEQLIERAGLGGLAVRQVPLSELAAGPPPSDCPRPWRVDLTGGNTETKVMLSDWSRDHRLARTAVVYPPDRDPLKTRIVEVGLAHL